MDPGKETTQKDNLVRLSIWSIYKNQVQFHISAADN